MFSQKSNKSQFGQFDEKGVRGNMVPRFGAEMNDIINELNRYWRPIHGVFVEKIHEFSLLRRQQSQQ
jgi:hypothetical protein